MMDSVIHCLLPIMLLASTPLGAPTSMLEELELSLSTDKVDVSVRGRVLGSLFSNVKGNTYAQGPLEMVDATLLCEQVSSKKRYALAKQHRILLVQSGSSINSTCITFLIQVLFQIIRPPAVILDHRSSILFDFLPKESGSEIWNGVAMMLDDAACEKIRGFVHNSSSNTFGIISTLKAPNLTWTKTGRPQADFIILLCVLAIILAVSGAVLTKIQLQDKKKKRLFSVAIQNSLAQMHVRSYQSKSLPLISGHEDPSSFTLMPHGGESGKLIPQPACVICLEVFRAGEVIRSLPCCHEFHRGCVDRWLLQHWSCPLCKSCVIGGSPIPGLEITWSDREDSGLDLPVMVDLLSTDCRFPSRDRISSAAATSTNKAPSPSTTTSLALSLHRETLF